MWLVARDVAIVGACQIGLEGVAFWKRIWAPGGCKQLDFQRHVSFPLLLLYPQATLGYYNRYFLRAVPAKIAVALDGGSVFTAFS